MTLFANPNQTGDWSSLMQMSPNLMMPQAFGAMPTSADLNWSNPATGQSLNPFALNQGAQQDLLAGWGAGATAPADTSTSSGGFMGLLRGQKGVAGDGLAGWLGNGQNLSAIMNGIGALTGAWLGYQNLKVAKDQLGFQKDAFQKNFANQTKTYNTSLEDRIRGRTADYAGKESDVQAYLDKNKLPGS